MLIEYSLPPPPAVPQVLALVLAGNNVPNTKSFPLIWALLTSRSPVTGKSKNHPENLVVFPVTSTSLRRPHLNAATETTLVVVSTLPCFNRPRLLITADDAELVS